MPAIQTRNNVPDNMPAITFLDLLVEVSECKIDEGVSEEESIGVVRLALLTACDDTLEELASECVTLFFP